MTTEQRQERNEKRQAIRESKKIAKSLSIQLLQTANGLNEVEQREGIKPHFYAHWIASNIIDPKTDKPIGGIENLILEIMKNEGEPMSIEQIFRIVNNIFPSRYGIQVVRNYMSIKMLDNGKLRIERMSKEESDDFNNARNLPVAKKPCNLYRLALRITSIIWE